MIPAIEVRDLGKRYWQLEDRAMLLKSITPFVGAKKSEYWALRDLNLEVAQGETIGILGRNGAGKTTLLRLLAGVSRPTVGRITRRGRVAPLISVGVGFHQEMSGRENIFVNGLLLGLTKRQIVQRFDQIVAFSELGDFIDTPVKFYSSGMYMRLGFSVATHCDPDILLVDEVLAVGDGAFQMKCLERMRELRSSGATIVMVSHSMHAIRLLCPRALLIRRGRLEFDGPSEEAIARHHELMTADQDGAAAGPRVSIVDRQLLSRRGPTHHAESDEPLTYRCSLVFTRDIDSPQFRFHVLAEDASLAYEIYSTVGREGRTYRAGEVATVEVPFLARLGGGTYRLCLTVGDRKFHDIYAHDGHGVSMYVTPLPNTGGVADLGASITLDGVDVSHFGSVLLADDELNVAERGSS